MSISRIISFLTKTQYSFEEKRPYENVSMVIRRHWFVIAARIAGFFFILFLFFILATFAINYFNDPAITSVISFLFSLFLLYWWAQMFYAIAMYMLDIWIITDHRVIDSEQHGFFNRSVAELNFSKVQDISVRIEGIIPTFLNYGDLEIQTAGTEQKFHFKQISDPEEVKNRLSHLYSEYTKLHQGGVEVHEKASGV